MTLNNYYHYLPSSILIQIDVSHQFFLVSNSRVKHEQEAQKNDVHIDLYEKFVKNTTRVNIFTFKIIF